MKGEEKGFPERPSLQTRPVGCLAEEAGSHLDWTLRFEFEATGQWGMQLSVFSAQYYTRPCFGAQETSTERQASRYSRHLQFKCTEATR